MKIKKLNHFLEISSKVKKFIKKLDNKTQNIVLKRIYELEKNPIPSNKNHIIDINKNKLLCELSVSKLRFYYVIVEGRVLINDVEFLGIVKLNEAHSNHKSGNSKNYPNQQKFINWLKKLFKKEN